MIKKISTAFLLLLFCWAIYLMQVDPEAEAFFYSYSEQEKKEINHDIENFLNHKPVKIPVVGDIDIFDCWNNTRIDLNEEIETCASNLQLDELVSQNQDLLDKYQSFKRNPERSEFLSVQTLINGKRLLMIKIYLMTSEREYAKALSRLVEDNDFWKKKLVAGASGWVNQAIYMAHLGLNQSVLPHLLNTDHNFSESEYSQLKKLITPIEINELKLEKTIRGEFELVKEVVPELKKDAHPIANRFLGAFINQAYEDAQELIENTRLSFTESCTKKISNIKPQDQYSSGSFITSVIKLGPRGYFAKAFILLSPKSALSLISEIHNKNAYRKLFNLIILLKEKNISSSEISTFIKGSPDLATNPLTGNLFEYDQEEKKISMDATECSEPWSISLSNFN